MERFEILAAMVALKCYEMTAAGSTPRETEGPNMGRAHCHRREGPVEPTHR
jgi:hypothetical protein